MKHSLNFATKLNSRDIQKCHWLCVGIPSYDLFASVRKAVFPAPKVTGVQIKKHVVVSVSSNLPEKKFNSRFWTKVWTPQSKIPGSAPVKGTAESMVVQKPLRIRRIGDWIFYFFSWLWVLTRDREIENALIWFLWFFLVSYESRQSWWHWQNVVQPADC